MDITTLIGLLVGVGCMVVAFLMDGGHLMALLKPTAAIIVFGGTIGATVAGYKLEEIKTVPQLLRIAFTEQNVDIVGLIRQLAGIADKARREGLLSLEQELADVEDRFLRQGLQLIIDGT
ncbi:MAG: motility protein A, partial [Syntrophomonadaceae bacterium]|nr:motility protein A [Syntrophomonadaceae bacterium]